MKLLIAILALALTAAISVTAIPYTEKVFDGYVLEGINYKTSNNENFTIDMPSKDKILVNLPQARIIVENNTCTYQFNYSTCFKGISFSHYNYSLANSIVNKALITIDKSMAKINLSRNVSTDMSLEQEYKVKTTLQNIGDVAAENVRFSDYYPLGLEVHMTSDCTILINNVTWAGRLEPNEKIQCTYTIIPKKNMTYISTAYADYFNSIRFQKEENSLTINVAPYPVQVTDSLSNYSPDISSEVEINFTIRTTKNTSIDYLLTIPPEFKIIKSDNAMTRTENMLTYSGFMKDNETKVFKNRIIPQYFGNFTISSSTKFKADEVSDTIETNVPVNATFKEPYVRIGKTSLEKKQGQISIFIINPSNHTIYDISLTVKGLVNSNQTENALSGISHTEYVYDYAGENGKHNITTILKYKTEYYQRFIEIKTEQVTIETAEEKIPEIAPANETEAISYANKTIAAENKSPTIDIKKGIARSKIIALIFGGLIALVIALGFFAAKLKKKEKTEEKREPELKDLIK